MRHAVLHLACAALSLAAGCSGDRRRRDPYAPRVGDPLLGQQVIRAKSCGACHTIPGVRGADGVVGPPLMWFARRTYIAGQLPNTPDNLVRWLEDPQAVESGTAMPALGLDESQARDVAAYLYTLR